KPPATATSIEEWARQRDEWLTTLKEKCFAAWPERTGPLELRQVFSAEHRGVDLDAYEFTSQPNVRLHLHLARRAHLKKPERVVLIVQDAEDWQKWIAGVRHAFGNELESDVPEGQPVPKADAKEFDRIRRGLASNNCVFV